MIKLLVFLISLNSIIAAAGNAQAPVAPAAQAPVAPAAQATPTAAKGDDKNGDASKKPLPIKFDPLNESAPEEVLVLQELAKRSEELRAREEAFKLQTLTFKAAEAAMEEKLKSFDTLKQELTKLLDQIKEKDEKQFKDLVKIYTAMKPKQAAVILNQLDMPILKEIIKRMNQKKSAVILAAMDVRKAKEVTQRLANEGQKIS